MTTAQPKLIEMPKPKVKRKKNARVRGQGSLFLRGDMYWFELNWKKTRTRMSLETTDRDEALRRMAAKVAAIHSGESPKTFEPVTVGTLCEVWLAEVERTCKQSTYEDYQSRWVVHLEPVFGEMIASQVTKDVVSKYLSDRKREGGSIIAQNRENRVLQMIFNYNRKKISANNFPEFPAMHSEKNTVRKGRLSKADYETLLTRLEEPKNFWLRVLVTMTFKYGFRRAELQNAKVGYFNAANSTFTLPGYTTKNKTEREVAVKRDGQIYKMLVELTKGRAADAAMFVRTNGLPVKDYRRAWDIVTEGLTNGRGGRVTVHDLRRSAITNMSNKGVSAAQAGTHLSPDVFARYIVRNEKEKQSTSAIIEGD